MVSKEDLWKYGDVNRDAVINQADLDLITAAVGSRPGDPRWNPDADLNQDSVIDMADIQICSINQGMKATPEYWEIWFPGLTIPGTIKAGALLDLDTPIGHFKIPPGDIKLFKENLVIWRPFLLFSVDWIIGGVAELQDAANDVLLAKIPDLVWSAAETTLDKWAADFYERHKKE